MNKKRLARLSMYGALFALCLVNAWILGKMSASISKFSLFIPIFILDIVSFMGFMFELMVRSKE